MSARLVLRAIARLAPLRLLRQQLRFLSTIAMRRSPR